MLAVALALVLVLVQVPEVLLQRSAEDRAEVKVEDKEVLPTWSF